MGAIRPFELTVPDDELVALADRLDRDQSENYASPAKPRVHNLSGV